MILKFSPEINTCKLAPFPDIYTCFKVSPFQLLPLIPIKQKLFQNTMSFWSITTIIFLCCTLHPLWLFQVCHLGKKTYHAFSYKLVLMIDKNRTDVLLPLHISQLFNGDEGCILWRTRFFKLLVDVWMRKWRPIVFSLKFVIPLNVTVFEGLLYSASYILCL